MAKKCTICKEKVETTFLQKPLGTWIKDANSKKQLICRICQKQYSLEEIKEKL